MLSDAVMGDYKLFFNKKPFLITLTETHVSWTLQTGANQDGDRVRVRDVLSARSDSTDVGGQLTLTYITQQKNRALRKTVANFNGELEICTKLSEEINNTTEKVSERPRRVLVFINPISGSRKAPDIYSKIVAPIFHDANIQTDVIVTERAHHSEEVISAYDLQSIDGIVFVGGDGMYHEVTNGLIRRLASDSGKDINDPAFVPPVFPLTIGVIPGGTGNGIARAFMGTGDVETAAYSIVLGYRSRSSVQEVRCAGKLVGYAALMVGYGVWGDAFLISQNNRHLGMLRQTLLQAKFLLFESFRDMDIRIRYKCRDDVNAVNKEFMRIQRCDPPVTPVSDLTEYDGDKSSIDTEASGCKETGNNVETTDKNHGLHNMDDHKASCDWHLLSDRFIGILSLCSSKFGMFDEDLPEPRLYGDFGTTAIINNLPMGRFKLLRFLINMATNPSYVCSQRPNESPVLLASEWHVEVNKPSPVDSEKGRKERVVTLDGELAYLHRPEYHVRFFPGKVPLYCNLPSITRR